MLVLNIHAVKLSTDIVKSHLTGDILLLLWLLDLVYEVCNTAKQRR